MSKKDEQITAGARALCKQMAEACGVDVADQWQLYAETFKEDARAVLEAANCIKEPLTPREIELLDGMIEVQLHHASQCDRIANRTMAEKQKGWDMERVALLRKLREKNA